MLRRRLFKRYAIVAAGEFQPIARLRLAVEVYEGQAVQIIDFDLRPSRNCGHLQIGRERHQFEIKSPGSDDLYFCVSNEVFLAQFEEDRVKVVLERTILNGRGSGRPAPKSTWWVGTSMNDRHKEPLVAVDYAILA